MIRGVWFRQISKREHDGRSRARASVYQTRLARMLKSKPEIEDVGIADVFRVYYFIELFLA